MNRLSVRLTIFLVGLSAIAGAQASRPGAPTATVVTDTKAAAEAESLARTLSKDMVYLESENFTWCMALPKDQTKAIIDTGESVYRQFAKDAGLLNWSEMVPGQRPMVVLTPTKSEFDMFSEWYAETYPVYDKKKFVDAKKKTDWYAAVASRAMLAGHVKPLDGEFLKMTVAHLVGHLVVQRHAYNNNFVPAWLDEGVAAYYEAKVAGRVGIHCFSLTRDRQRPHTSEKVTSRGATLMNFHSKLKKDLAKPDALSLQMMWQPSLSDMTLVELTQGYAVVSWMASQPGKLPLFIKTLKRLWPTDVTPEYTSGKGRAQEKALQEVFNLEISEVELAGREYVQKKL